MNMQRPLLLAAGLVLLAQPVFAASNPWLGTWKLNRDKSNFTGDTFTIANVGGKYHMDFGAVKFDFAEDGQDYPTMPDRTVSLKKTGDNEWLQVLKFKGQETSRTTMKLSSDGKTLTSHQTGTRADGSTYSSDSTDVRVGAGSGLAGTWKTTKDSSSAPETIVYSDAGDGAVKMYDEHRQSTVVTKLDGKPVTATGPRAVAEETMTFKATSPTSYKWTVLEKGKPYVEGTDTVSADGKVIKEENWLVTKPAEKYTLIYEKQ